MLPYYEYLFGNLFFAPIARTFSGNRVNIYYVIASFVSRLFELALLPGASVMALLQLVVLKPAGRYWHPLEILEHS